MVRTMKPATKGAVASERREARSLRDPLRNGAATGGRLKDKGRFRDLGLQTKGEHNNAGA
jgi:hypothetical protein